MDWNARPPVFGTEDTFIHMLQDMDYAHDPFAADLLWAGWFDENSTYEQRREAREMWFDYTGMGTYEFDWDQWREWYGDTSQAS